VIAKLMSYKLG